LNARRKVPSRVFVFSLPSGHGLISFLPMARIPKIVLLVESSRASGRAILNGVANYARYHGPWSFYWEPGGLEKVGPMLKTLDADGIILRDVDKLRETRAFGIPAVVVGYSRKEIPGLINVITDSPTIGRMAAEHLLRCGFKNFASCSYRRTPWAEQRAEAFAGHIRAAAFEVHEYLTPPPAQINWLKERRAMAKWLESLPKPVGVMACNDDIGVQILEACKLARIAVPDAVGVIGADNDEVVCGLADPAMSSVAVNFERAGYESAQALDHLMRKLRGTPPQIIVQATHIVARRSTDVVAVEDEAVARAMRFIRDHTRGPVAVAEVAKAAGLSRRVLERRFRREFNSSVQAEIRRVRTDQIARLLVETHMPVSDIAESLGFPDVQHFARYFRAGKKVSPLAFRRRMGLRSATNG
jgi:LacI family transcriptional regulator